MKNRYLSTLILLLCGVSVSAQAPANYELIWQDEFDAPRNSDGSLPLPDTNKWWFETGGHGWGNNELQYYVDKMHGTDTVAKIQDGKLIITAIKLATPLQGKNYVSARMNTSESWKYGYFEMKAKLPGGRGTWAAFWMMPENFKAWPLDGEIDILEYVGYRPKVVQSTIHTQAYNHMIQTDKSGMKTIETAETEFHTYGLEWTKDKIIGYVDGEAYFVFENDKEGNKNTWPFYEPFYLKLNLAIGGDWGGSQGVDTSIFPSRYEIDYVRVYENNTPTAEFKVSSKIGFIPCAVQFTNQSLKATEYLWDFGDGTTSMEENPTHTYNSVGTYTISLIAKNENGEEKVEKKDIITLINPIQLAAGGVVIEGNMENSAAWNTSFLNSVTTGYPAATWNYTDKTPTAGQGGALNIQGSATNGTSVFCIYQKVEIDKNRIYKFDAAIREMGGGNLDNFFAEVYISKDVAPSGSSNFNSGTKIASIQTADGQKSIYPGMDGTFQLHGDVQDFIPPESGEHYLVVKIGAIDFTGSPNVFNVSLDELSLTAFETKPYTDFSAKNHQGFVPLEVTFTNNTKFGKIYNWDFGDGTTSNLVEQEVKHTYTTEGVYTVSLTATNAQGDSTMVRKDFVVVGAPTVRPKGEQFFGGNMENPAFWKVATLNADFPTTLTWNYRESIPVNGVGGCLRLQATSKNGESNVAIYQEVELSKDTLYTFDCLYKDLGASNHLWAQAYITTEEPSNGKDLFITEAYTIGQLNTWVNGRVVGYDGKFSALATKGGSVSSSRKVCEYLPESDGKYYFVFKVGNTDWEGIDYKLDIALDELSLIASKSVSGIDGYHSDTLKVYAADERVVIRSENNIEKVNIYNLSGVLLEAATPRSNEYTSRRLSTGVYVVEVNNATYKVIIK